MIYILHSKRGKYIYISYKHIEEEESDSSLTWRYFANGGRMPAVTLITVRTLYKDTRVGQTFGEHLAADIIQPDTLADVSSSLLDHRVAIYIGQQTEAETLRVTWISETIHGYTRLRRVKRLAHSRV